MFSYQRSIQHGDRIDCPNAIVAHCGCRLVICALINHVQTPERRTGDLLPGQRQAFGWNAAWIMHGWKRFMMDTRHASSAWYGRPDLWLLFECQCPSSAGEMGGRGESKNAARIGQVNLAAIMDAVKWDYIGIGICCSACNVRFQWCQLTTTDLSSHSRDMINTRIAMIIMLYFLLANELNSQSLISLMSSWDLVMLWLGYFVLLC